VTVAVVAVKFPPFITASSWRTIVVALASAVKDKRGSTRLTNGEVITVIMAWLAAIGHTRIAARFPLWYQFAATAYGWDPKKRDRLVTTTKQRDALYSSSLNDELWSAMTSLADELERDAWGTPRLDLDGRFDDVVFQGEVRAALKQDGAQAMAKIPTGACRDKKTGKVRYPRLTDKPGDCVPESMDEPITVIKKKATNMFQLALLVGAVWLLWDSKPRRTRRTRRA
jgi:hypothetical protein